MVNKLLSSRRNWFVAIVVVLTIQLYDQETYTRFVLRNTRQAITYEWVAWNANLNDAYDRDHIAPPKSKK